MDYILSVLHILTFAHFYFQLDKRAPGTVGKIVWEEKVGSCTATSFFSYLPSAVWRKFLALCFLR